MTHLVTHPLPAGVLPAVPDMDAYARVTLDDPASAVMTDLRRYHAVTIREPETLVEAERLMVSAGVRLLLVVGADGTIKGVVTYRDLTGQRTLAVATCKRLARADITVAEIMTPTAEVETLDYRAVSKARVRDLIEWMHARGRQHALVTEAGAVGQLVVRGIFSTTQIGRQLGIPVEAGERARSFVEIEQLIAHN